MTKFAEIAWRNIWRNKRRSLLTLGMLTVGLALFIFSWSFGDGFHDEMIRNVVQTEMAQIQIHKKGFLNNPVLKTKIDNPQKILMIVRDTKGIKAFAPRIKTQALASTAYSSSNVTILGIDPALEESLTVIQNKLVNGRYLKSSSTQEAMLGVKLAKKLKIDVGDKVIVMGQALSETLKANALKVVGLYYTSDESLDKYTVYVPIKEAQAFFELGSAISEVAVTVKNENKIDNIVKELKREINDSGIEILSWRKVNPGLVQFIEVDNWALYIMIFVVAVIIGLEVYNTLLMSILERTREFGIMLSVGTKPSQIVLIVMFEALFMGLVMIAFGATIGGLCALYFVYHPMNFSFVAQGMELFSISKLVHFSLGWWHIVYSSMIMLSIVVLAAVYPARKASGLKPVDAIRFL
jgi:putative ABC transport system permease protein